MGLFKKKKEKEPYWKQIGLPSFDEIYNSIDFSKVKLSITPEEFKYQVGMDLRRKREEREEERRKEERERARMVEEANEKMSEILMLYDLYRIVGYPMSEEYIKSMEDVLSRKRRPKKENKEKEKDVNIIHRLVGYKDGEPQFEKIVCSSEEEARRITTQLRYGRQIEKIKKEAPMILNPIGKFLFLQDIYIFEALLIGLKNSLYIPYTLPGKLKDYTGTMRRVINRAQSGDDEDLRDAIRLLYILTKFNLLEIFFPEAKSEPKVKKYILWVAEKLEVDKEYKIY